MQVRLSPGVEEPRTPTPQAGVAATVKRGVDVVVSATALLVTAPILAAVAVAVLLGMGRPVLFRQQRIGRYGGEFTILKFRSMAGGGDGFSPGDDQARLTPLGRWLRATSLDELPSLWNILRGDMSLVGPRPFPTSYRDLYTPEQFRRHDVRPGLTGLAQVNGRNELGWAERFAYDLRYVEHWSLRLDARILARTAVAVLRRQGISAPGAATAHEFRGTAAEDPVAATAGSGSR
ncbi:sugar transferase [Micromonospora chalcea]|uniref:sugar transferase n=1 Tax=Micromonospora TaxID=1873 RepID=UPI00197BCADC|nr:MULTISPECIES: sugar transferase [unclassified Micromonospora]MBP1782423.1 lipopolysaccharide/colanic/teichoic acid biosynthesis glycosyltransferase [Micromonospora sp. HB375]MBQ1063000.1 sugar transferase [Micromonospora sp. C41]MDH6468287.1 lipopolysaccharide/colanic/teichoic acid biosynthesis glycosyltransferase [Micromonospora sp. H404/HB375]